MTPKGEVKDASGQTVMGDDGKPLGALNVDQSQAGNMPPWRFGINMEMRKHAEESEAYVSDGAFRFRGNNQTS